MNRPVSPIVYYPDACLPVYASAALVAAVLLAHVPVLMLGAAVCAGLAIALSSLRRSVGRWSLVLIAVSFGLALGASLTVAPRYRPVDPNLLVEARTVVGYLTQDASVSADSDPRFQLRLRRVEGDTVAFDADGVLTVIAPGVGEVAAGRILRVRVDTISVLGGSPLVRSQAVDTIGWFAPHYRWRSLARQQLFGRIDLMGYRAGGLFRALVTGSRVYLTRAHQAAFRESGSSHLLALSGMHLGIIAAIVYAALRFLVGRRAAFLVTLTAALGYVYLVGARPSLLRALVMLTLVGSLGMIDRRTESVNILALSVGLLVCSMPSLVHELSFQLSALSILGIVTVGKRIRWLLAPWMPSCLAAGLSAAAGAQLLTAPLTLLVFGVVHPVAVFSSLLLIPLVTLFVWTGLLWLVLSVVFPGMHTLLVSILLLREQASGIHHVAGLFATVPSVPSQWAGVIVLMVAILVAALYLPDLRAPGVMGRWPLSTGKA